jgi:ABC-type multidrug transport system permease subunit
MSGSDDDGAMPGKATWIAVAVAVAVIVLLIVVVAQFWTGLGDSGMSAGGWVALVLGVLATLALGIGLMALVFISNRRGYDDPGADGR